MANILLTGSNGFLGSHILRDLILNTNNCIYCIIRGKDFDNAKNKFEKAINYYFSEKDYIEKFNNINFIFGDIGADKFGLTVNEYNTLSNVIDIVINSAGLTKHYGVYEEFNEANVKTVENLTKFCVTLKNKILYHISTMSVSGQFLCEPKSDKKIIYTEKCLNIGQDIEKNVYIKSKYVAEEKVNEYIKNGGIGSIIRVGNLTCRFEDGKKQLDVKNNAFTNRFVAFSNIGYIFNQLENLTIEFSPVDLTSKAVVLLVDNNIRENILHVYNNNYVKFGEILKNITKLSKEEFVIKLKNDVLTKPKIREILPHIINDLSQNSDYISSIENSNVYSNKILHSIGFDWPIITDYYINFFLDTLVEESGGI